METILKILFKFLIGNVLFVAVHCVDYVEELNTFSKCHEESIPTEILASKIVKPVADCILTSPKYCQYRCIAIGLAVINSKTFEISEKATREFVKEFEFKKKEILILGALKCAEGIKFTTRSKCRTFRTFVYCVRNLFLTECKTNAKKFDVNQNTEEDADILEDTKGLLL